MNGGRNGERDALSGGRSGAQDARSDGTRATARPRPSQQSKPLRSAAAGAADGVDDG
jgi:hypothetical protein